MQTTMQCPSCQTTLRLREDLAGKKIKCPRCAQVVQVPAAEDVVVAEATSGDEITDKPSAPRSKSKAGTSTRPCPECGEPVAVTARKCRHCKAVLDEEDERDRRPQYKPCPRCGETGAKRVVWTPWGSFYGPALFTHVRCPGCGYAYNGRSGRSNLIPAIIFVMVPLILILVIFAFLGWIIYARMFAGNA
jgi:predicted Zn finger-like uncharacterized protein